jgi:hypothetical protein
MYGGRGGIALPFVRIDVFNSYVVMEVLTRQFRKCQENYHYGKQVSTPWFANLIPHALQRTSSDICQWRQC